MIQNIIFDLDGTLIDSFGDVIDCLKKTYAQMNIPFTLENERSVIGPTLKKAIKMISPTVSDKDIDGIIIKFKELYDTSNYSHTFFMKDAQDLLIECQNKKIRMFIATNKRLIPTKRILKKLDILDFFEDIVTVDSNNDLVKNKIEMISYILEKHNLGFTETVMIGDTASDVQAAHYNKIAAVAYTNGYGDKIALKKTSPEYMVKELQEINSII